MVNAEARRIVDLTHDGKPVTAAQEFVVATNNYRASGGGNFPGTKTTVILEAPDLNRDVVVRHIIEKKRIDPSADGNWSLAPLPRGVVATFLSGPGSAAAIPQGAPVERMGEGPDGFLKYRLRTA